MKSKKARILILMTFLISLFISVGGYFITRMKQDIEIIYEKPTTPILKENFINWPIIDSDALKYSIVGYNGEISEDIFKESFNKEFHSKYEGDKKIGFNEPEFIFEDELIKVKIKTNTNPEDYINPQKTYYYKLRKNL